MKLAIAGGELTTNNHPRELMALDELPDSVKPEFTYVTKDDAWELRFVHAYGEWWDILDTDTRKDGWAFASQSMWSAVAFRYAEDNEYVIVGRWVSS